MTDSLKPATLHGKGGIRFLPVPSAPFDSQNDGADVTLRTSDKVDFHIHKIFLSFASPFFKDMFSLPQPKSTEAIGISLLPIIDVPEDSRTIDIILRCCYPFSSPRLTTLDEVRRVFEAALKYDMPVVQEVAEAGIKAAVDWHPLGVFAIGCQFDRNDICASAATRLLQHSLRSLPSHELHELPVSRLA